MGDSLVLSHICTRCNKKVSVDKPPMFIAGGKGIYFFCSIRCREKWVYPGDSTLNLEQKPSGLERDLS